MGMGEHFVDGIDFEWEVGLDGLVEGFGLGVAGEDFVLFVRKALFGTPAGTEVIGGSEAHE